MSAPALNRTAVVKPYKCSRCDKRFPSPESGSAHLTKKHNGEGFLSWFHVLKRNAIETRSESRR